MSKTTASESDFLICARVANCLGILDLCGMGKYLMIACGDPGGAGHFGITPVGGVSIRITACDVCGHVQMFRLDLATQSARWGYTNLQSRAEEHIVEKKADDNIYLMRTHNEGKHVASDWDFGDEPDPYADE